MVEHRDSEKDNWTILFLYSNFKMFNKIENVQY